MEGRIEGNVACVVQHQVELDLVRLRAQHVPRVERDPIGRNRSDLRNAMLVLPADRAWRQQLAKRLSIGIARITPVAFDWIPPVTQAFLIGVAVLGNNGRDALGVGHCHTEAGRSTVVKM